MSLQVFLHGPHKHDTNSNNLGGFLHIKADLVYTRAGKYLWHLFYTTFSTRWVGFTLSTQQQLEGANFESEICRFITDQILWCGCINSGQHSQLLLHWAWKQMQVTQCKPGLPIRTHNKNRNTRRSYWHRKRVKESVGLGNNSTTVNFLPVPDFKLSSPLLLVWNTKTKMLSTKIFGDKLSARWLPFIFYCKFWPPGFYRNHTDTPFNHLGIVLHLYNKTLIR